MGERPSALVTFGSRTPEPAGAILRASFHVWREILMKKLFWDAVAILAPGNRQARHTRRPAGHQPLSRMAK